ncbi:DUF4214 domain-containing protein [Vreelandella arctica]|uniref:DUF4214 domain-containing protein n=1 Tax=Vreelandella arctica TaxID=3126499 RepID=UPI00300E4053
MSSLSTQQTLQAFYLGVFGRAADPDGFNYWSSQIDSGAIELTDALGAMLQSDEFAERQNELPQSENDVWIDDIYQDFFGRDADSGGAEYWSSLLSQGVSAQEVIQRIILSASATDKEALDATTSIARFYTENVSNTEYDADQPLIQQGLRSNEQLYSDLAALDATYDTMALDQVGESLEGRPLYSATVGEGERKLMIVTQQHGDEPTGTEAAMLLLEWLSGDSEAAQALRSEMTVTVMPRVNPDGFERWEQLTYGDAVLDDTIDPRRNSADMDLNRTWDSSEAIDPALIPEALAVREVLAAFQPELILDYHNQNNYLNAEGELETISVLWPTNELVDTEITAAAQQAAMAVSQGIEGFDFGSLSLYPGSETPQIARNGLGIDGVPALLIEQRGLEEMEIAASGELDVDYSALSSSLILESLLSMLGVITAMGNDELEMIDPALATMIPERGERIAYEDIYLEGMAEDDGAMLAMNSAEGGSGTIRDPMPDTVEVTGVDTAAANADMWAA